MRGVYRARGNVRSRRTPDHALRAGREKIRTRSRSSSGSRHAAECETSLNRRRRRDRRRSRLPGSPAMASTHRRVSSTGACIALECGDPALTTSLRPHELTSIEIHGAQSSAMRPSLTADRRGRYAHGARVPGPPHVDLDVAAGRARGAGVGRPQTRAVTCVFCGLVVTAPSRVRVNWPTCRRPLDRLVDDGAVAAARSPSSAWMPPSISKAVASAFHRLGHRDRFGEAASTPRSARAGRERRTMRFACSRRRRREHARGSDPGPASTVTRSPFRRSPASRAR